MTYRLLQNGSVTTRMHCGEALTAAWRARTACGASLRTCCLPARRQCSCVTARRRMRGALRLTLSYCSGCCSLNVLQRHPTLGASTCNGAHNGCSAASHSIAWRLHACSKRAHRADRSSDLTTGWQQAAAESCSGASFDLNERFSEIVGVADESAAQPQCSVSLPPPAGNDWRPLEDYPPALGSPRYQPFAQRMMVASPSGKATARRDAAHDSAAHGNGRCGQGAALQAALPPASARDKAARSAHLVAAEGDGTMASDEQHDPNLHSEDEAIQRLGSFGPWYERTLAAMTNLQQLGSGPLGVKRAAARGDRTAVLNARPRDEVTAPAAADRNGLAQMLLPSPTRVVPFTGACCCVPVI